MTCLTSDLRVAQVEQLSVTIGILALVLLEARPHTKLDANMVHIRLAILAELLARAAEYGATQLEQVLSRTPRVLAARGPVVYISWA